MPTRQRATMQGGKMIPTSSSGSGIGAIGWLFVGLGVVFLAFFFNGIAAQVQTNEAAILGQQVMVTWRPNWDVYMQIPQLFLGGGNAAQPMANYVSWFIEFLFVALSIGYDIVHIAAGYGGRTLGKIFWVFSWGIVLYNMFNDYNYGTLGSVIGGHLTFMIVASGVVAFAGKIGMFFIEKGLGV